VSVAVPPDSDGPGALLAEPPAGEQDRAGVSGHPGAPGAAGGLSAPRDLIAELRGLHKPFGIYAECGHEHAEDDPAAVSCGDFVTCEDGFLHWVCQACCCRNEEQTAECAEHHEHGPGLVICPTAWILDGAP